MKQAVLELGECNDCWYMIGECVRKCDDNISLHIRREQAITYNCCQKPSRRITFRLWISWILLLKPDVVKMNVDEMKKGFIRLCKSISIWYWVNIPADIQKVFFYVILWYFTTICCCTEESILLLWSRK